MDPHKVSGWSLLGQWLLVWVGLCWLWPTPAAAEIITVDPSQPPPSLLTAAEREKLVVLQNTQDLILFSGVSPDDRTVVIGAAPLGDPHQGEPEPPQLAFLNLEDGALQPIDPLFLTLQPQAEIGWRDAQTAVYLSSNAAGEAVLVSLDRRTGGVESSPLSLSGRPISLAPNGTRLLVEIPGDEGIRLASVDLATGASEPLLDYPSGTGPTQIAWTADGTKLAFVRLMPSAALAADVEHATEVATQDTLGKLPLTQNPFFQGNVVAVFDLATHKFQPAALRAAQGDGYLFQQVSWSPDGQFLLAKMVRPSHPLGRQHPSTFFPDRAYFRLYDATLAQIGTLDRPELEAAQATQALFLSPDELVFAAPAGITFRLYAYERRSGEFRALPTADGTFAEAPSGYQIHATHRSRQLVYNHSSFQQPPEIYRLGLDDAAPQPLTRFNATAAAMNQIRVDQLSLPLTERITRTGYLLQPADAQFPPQAVPLVLYQQGGPGGAMTNRWGATPEEPFNLLPNFGIAVLFMPFAGREGFGPEFLNALVDGRKFGAADIDEAAQAVQALLAQGYTTPGQVGITGCSYGGYFTSQSLVRHPQLYAAANAQCSPLDLVNWWQSVGRLLVTYVEGRLPSESRFEYRSDSPLHRAARIRTPLLLFHAAEDFLPVALARDFHDQIAATGSTVTLLVFEQEGHSLTLPSSRYLAAQCQLLWFRRYLGIMADQTPVCPAAPEDAQAVRRPVVK